MLRASPKAWPLSHGLRGHGTRSIVVRTALMVMSVMALRLAPLGSSSAVSEARTLCRHCEPVHCRRSVGDNRLPRLISSRREVGVVMRRVAAAEDVCGLDRINIAAYSDALVVLGTAGIVVPIVSRLGFSPMLGYLGAGAILGAARAWARSSAHIRSFIGSPSATPRTSPASPSSASSSCCS